MAVIVQTSFQYDNGATRTRAGLALRNEEILRPLGIGSNFLVTRYSLTL